MPDHRCFLLQAILLLLTLFGCSRPSAETPHPLTHEAYLWQDPARPAAITAITRARGHLDGICVLVAEGGWKHGKLTLRKCAEAPRGDGFSYVIRLGQSTAGLDWTGDHGSAVSALVAELAALHPREIQIDYDCPSRRLSDYKQFLLTLQKSAADVRLTFTALPSWLDTPTFEPLAKAFPGYVLQVHALELPESPEVPLVLCDPTVAHRAVKRASSYGVAFRVALPTYGSEALFGADGKVLDVISEDQTSIAPERITMRSRVFADPVVMADLVRQWTAQAPPEMRGICWYRLPVQGDRRNWSWETFVAVIQGHASPAQLEVRAEKTSGSAHDVVIVNTGENHAALPQCVILPDNLLAVDAARPYSVIGKNPRVLKRDPLAPDWPWLPAGQRCVIGWFQHPAPPAHLKFTSQP